MTPRSIIHSATHAVWADNWMADVVTAPAFTVPPEHIIGPVGAGDAFCAGIVLGVHEGWTPQRSLAVAHRCAAASLKSVTATGSIPTLDVLDARLEGT
ncbi:MAG: carbohydrate kinase family protein [Pseudomonadota bacterium]